MILPMKKRSRELKIEQFDRASFPIPNTRSRLLLILLNAIAPSLSSQTAIAPPSHPTKRDRAFPLIPNSDVAKPPLSEHRPFPHPQT